MLPPLFRPYVGVACLLALFLTSFSALGVRLEVRGAAKLEARVVPLSGRVKLLGQLNDDRGRPLGQARVKFATNGPLVTPAPCGQTFPNRISTSLGVVHVDTDESGSFCLLLDVGAHKSLELEFEGDRYFERATTHVDLTVSRRSLELGFQPEPTTMSLEREAHAIWIDARVEPADAALDEALQLNISVEEGGAIRSIARVSTQAGQLASVSLPSKALGAPGAGNLIVEFAGSDSIQPARRAIPIQKTVHVNLTPSGSISSADSDGVDLEVAVGSVLGAVPGGSVEALVNGESRGAAPVVMGVARVHATFPLPAEGTVAVTLRYLPDAPWWLPGETATVQVPVSPPSPLRRLPWVIAAILVAASVIRAWWRPARTEKPEPKTEETLPTGRPSLEVVALGPAHSGWKGRVIDAHDGAPIRDARVSIVLPSFGNDTAPTVFSAEDGRFALEHVDRVEGASLQIEADYHATLVNALPPPGEISVSLVSRRRALLARLVDWANRMGRPWQSPTDPTPGQVIRAARSRRAEDIGAWAEEVERAAFGPEAPDAEREREIQDREPSWRSPGDAGH
jgi:hypothetical protein